jgi:DNA-binding GntR family transcriptional regulator
MSSLTCIHFVDNVRGHMAPRTARRPPTYLADRVYEALRGAIVAREFDPGEPLTEHDLCARFGVSRTPVREALAKLERDHLVRVVPKKGAFIRTLSHDEVRELYEVREALEALAVRLAVPAVDRGDLAGFEHRFRALKSAGARATYTDVRVLGEEFHRYLIKSAGNAKLAEILEQIRERIQSVWTLSIVAPRRVQAIVREHLAIIGALRASDGRRAERLMVEHVRRVRNVILRLVD